MVEDYLIPTFTKLRSAAGQGGPPNPGAWTQLVPDNKPPHPAYWPPSARTRDDLWNGQSHRLGREVFFNSVHEYNHWHLVEFCPWVKWFCEQYPQIQVMIDGRFITTRYDMLVCYVDNTLELREVKKSKVLDEPKDSKTEHQLAAQQFWAEKMGLPYRLLTDKVIEANPIFLSNCKKINRRLGKPMDNELLKVIVELMSDLYQCPMEKILTTVLGNEQKIFRHVLALLRQGVLEAPLGTQKLSKAIMIRWCDHDWN